MSPEDQQTLEADFERWMHSWGASPKTISTRLAFIRRLQKHHGDLTTVTAEDLSGWLADPKLEKWSRITYHSHMHSLYGWMTKTGRMPEDPTADLRRPKPPKGRPKPLTQEEENAALASARGNVRAWLVLALRAGLRAHEIAKIEGEHVQADNIFVRGKGDVEAFIPTSPHVWKLAQQYPRRGWWFPSPAHDGHISADSVTIMVGKLFREVGITSGSIHRARHTYATRLSHDGLGLLDVQEAMRHSSVATTALYVGRNQDTLRAATNRLGGAA